MKGLIKLVTGLAIGAAIGAGLYLILNQDTEEGFVGDMKKLARQVVEEGKVAAEQRRQELEVELGQRPATPD